MVKNELMQLLLENRQAWDDLLQQFGEEEILRPRTLDAWSVKDVIAHVTWFEREMIGLLRHKALSDSPEWQMSQAERNATIYEQCKDRSLPEVQAESRYVFSQLLDVLDLITDQDLNDPSRFAGMPPEWIPWILIADNTYDHYAAHTPAVLSYLHSLPSRSG